MENLQRGAPQHGTLSLGPVESYLLPSATRPHFVAQHPWQSLTPSAEDTCASYTFQGALFNIRREHLRRPERNVKRSVAPARRSLPRNPPRRSRHHGLRGVVTYKGRTLLLLASADRPTPSISFPHRVSNNWNPWSWDVMGHGTYGT